MLTADRQFPVASRNYTSEDMLNPDAIAETYWHLAHQDRSACQWNSRCVPSRRNSDRMRPEGARSATAQPSQASAAESRENILDERWSSSIICDAGQQSKASRDW